MKGYDGTGTRATLESDGPLRRKTVGIHRTWNEEGRLASQRTWIIEESYRWACRVRSCKEVGSGPGGRSHLRCQDQKRPTRKDEDDVLMASRIKLFSPRRQTKWRSSC